MPEKKSTRRSPRRPVTRILEDLDSSELSKRKWAIKGCADLAPQVRAVLVALLRGLNDPEDLVRLEASQGLLRAFPGAEERLSEVLSELGSDDAKVRVAAIARVVTSLPQVLMASSGMTPIAASAALHQPALVTEDLMEHAGRWVA
jgi:hypothetical protein